ncbi:MAG: ABC transporter substrate binding protein [Candidatus Ozemobacteraceae bacterium]
MKQQTHKLLAFAAVFGFFWLVCCLPIFAVSELWVLFRSKIPLHAETAAKMASMGKHHVILCPLEMLSASFLESRPPALVIAFGDSALQKALTMQWNVPIIGTFIENNLSDQRIYRFDTRQPSDLQIDLLVRLRKDLRHIWYPWSSQAFAPTQELKDAVGAAGLGLLLCQLDNPGNLPGALKAFTAENCAGILPPDPRLVNNAIIPSIFQESFRYKKPIVGFSESMVRQGAVFAFTMAPEELASGLLKYTDDLLRSPKTEAERSRKFSGWQLLLNVTVMKKIGLDPPEDVRRKAAKIF